MKIVQFVFKYDKRNPRVGVLSEKDLIFDVTSALGLKSVIEFIGLDGKFRESVKK